MENSVSFLDVWPLLLTLALLILPSVLFHKYRINNIFNIMMIYLILEPLAVATILWLMLIIITRNPVVIVISPFVLIPLISLYHLLLDHRDLEFLSKAKIALEWNQAISASISLIVALFLLLTPDDQLNFINTVFGSNNLSNDGTGNKDAINLVFLTISFPFVISFTLSKAFVEHLLHNYEVKQKQG